MTGTVLNVSKEVRVAVNRSIDRAIAELQSIKRLMNAKAPVFPKSASERLEAGLCLKCGKPLAIGKGRPARGNHASCYRAIIRAMSVSGELEDDAVEKGLLAPIEQAGRKPKHVSLDDLIESDKPAPKSKRGSS